MKNAKSPKTLSSFENSALNLSEMKKVKGGKEGGCISVFVADIAECLQDI